MCRMKRSNVIHMKEKLTLSDFSKSQLPLISVVVPVHNSARYLKKSAESIAAQTYKNLEILLVDDGSSDESSEIIESIARQDDRFRTIHALKSHGVSAARNSAIQAAKGTWICSADSDDIVPPHGIETLFLAVMEHGTRMAMGAYRECHVTQHMRFTRPVPAKPGVFNTPRELQKYFLTSGVNFNHMWTKIFHRDAFASARFPVGMIYEDIYLLPHLLDAAGAALRCLGCSLRKKRLLPHRQIEYPGSRAHGNPPGSCQDSPAGFPLPGHTQHSEESFPHSSDRSPAICAP